jgi:DNA-binding transcriptional regulator YiaG
MSRVLRVVMPRARRGDGTPIRALRQARGWTQEQFAAQLGVHPQTVAHWEQGRNRVSRLAEKMMKLL